VVVPFAVAAFTIVGGSFAAFRGAVEASSFFYRWSLELESAVLADEAFLSIAECSVALPFFGAGVSPDALFGVVDGELVALVDDGTGAADTACEFCCVGGVTFFGVPPGGWFPFAGCDASPVGVVEYSGFSELAHLSSHPSMMAQTMRMNRNVQIAIPVSMIV
jgi:hypothetical protein